MYIVDQIPIFDKLRTNKLIVARSTSMCNCTMVLLYSTSLRSQIYSLQKDPCAPTIVRILIREREEKQKKGKRSKRSGRARPLRRLGFPRASPRASPRARRQRSRPTKRSPTASSATAMWTSFCLRKWCRTSMTTSRNTCVFKFV